MTTRMKLVVTDDLDEQAGEYADIGDDGEKMVISLNGTVCELDLTAAHALELRTVMQRFIDAGHDPGEIAQPPLSQPVRLSGQGRRREIPGTRPLYQDLRDWAAASGIEIRTAGRDSKKNYVYSSDLKRDYAAHLVVRAGKGDAAAAARLAMATLLSFPGTEQDQDNVS